MFRIITKQEKREILFPRSFDKWEDALDSLRLIENINLGLKPKLVWEMSTEKGWETCPMCEEGPVPVGQYYCPHCGCG